ncbi:hypothetical protein Adt_37799 [Abeliophyllum distichum]|uniref:Uncharacterized protein n=1 Tax=Abeliophyllum distichum TaxID=126358 RepID=A0ABD1Q0G2_9LAMI
METTKIVSNLPFRPLVFTSREEASDVDTEDGAARTSSRGEKPLVGEGFQLQRGRVRAGDRNLSPAKLGEGRGCAGLEGRFARTSSREEKPEIRRGFSVAKRQSSPAKLGEGRFARTSSRRPNFSRRRSLAF